MSLTAIVIGSGWAGEGHTLALRSAGVEVVALCGRSREPAEALAQRLGIPHVRFDWRDAIADIEPDIVAIATPAAPHREMAEAAASQGCHLICDKPLAVNAAEARAMLKAVRDAGVRHAYCASSCLSPAITHANRLIADGLIGTLAGVESSFHGGWSPNLAYSWLNETKLGGGTLNNLLTHKLAQVLRVTGGTPAHVAGEARCLVTRAPIGPTIHDFRQLFTPFTDIDENDPSRWRPSDADTHYAIVLQLALPGGGEVTARFDGSTTNKSRTEGALSLYGTRGTLVLAGGNSPSELHHYDFVRDTWEPLTVPPETDVDMSHEDSTQRDWNTLIKRLATDIRGEPHGFYPTFEDGWRAAEIIELVRGGARVEVPTTA